LCCSQDRDAPSASLKDIPAIPTSVFVAVVQEYEESSETDSDGEMLIDRRNTNIFCIYSKLVSIWATSYNTAFICLCITTGHPYYDTLVSYVVSR